MPDWLCYQFPEDLLASWRAAGKGWGGKYVGQAQRWYVFRYTGAGDTEIDLNAHGDPEFCEWRWLPLGQGLVDAVVPFKQPVYAEVLRHVTQVMGLRPLGG